MGRRWMEKRWEHWRVNPEGRVYFTRFFDATGQTFIKVGRTVLWLPDRMRTIARDAWNYRRVLFIDWEVLGTMPGDFACERAAQHKLRTHMVRVVKCNGRLGYTEFFRDCVAVRNFVAQMAESVEPDEAGPDDTFLKWRDALIDQYRMYVNHCGWDDIYDDGFIQARLPIGIAALELVPSEH